jgi:hypothetical protein
MIVIGYFSKIKDSLSKADGSEIVSILSRELPKFASAPFPYINIGLNILQDFLHEEEYVGEV